MDLEARRRHLWILGKTGMGKTTLLQSIIKQDLDAGRGLAIMEPHGDLSESMLNFVPKRRKNDIVYFDPADENNRVTFNPLHVPAGSDKTLIADGVLASFQKVFGMDESQAPRLLHIFRNSLLSLVEMPSATLIDVQRILVEPIYRKSVIARVSNLVVRSFWLDEFGKWKPHDRTAFIASLQNKLGAFLTNEKLQRVLGDPKSKFDLRKIMDDGKVLIVNLSKGRLGENVSNLLGTLIVTSLQLAAMSRANIPEQSRRDFSIIMDEFQNFATPSIATFLSEARKYRTHLILANQYTQQIPEDILAAILGNVGSQIAFQLGTTDAELFESQLAGLVTANNLMNIPKYHAYCRMLIDGMPSNPFSMSTYIERK
jgi:type IV secretory pathway TraG/TraD family ATPase VirD4